MAYGVRVSPLEKTVIDGRSYTSVTITETDVTESDEAVVLCVPACFTITLFEAAISEQPIAADTTINPRLATESGSDPGPLAIVAQNQTAAAAIRNVGGVRVASPSSKLYLRSQPPSGVTVPTVVTRITLVQGMDIQTAVAAETAPATTDDSVVWSAVDDTDDVITATYGGSVYFSRYLTMPANIVQRGDVLRLWFGGEWEADSAAPDGDEVDGDLVLRLGSTIVAANQVSMNSSTPVPGVTYAEIRFLRAGLSAIASHRYWRVEDGDVLTGLSPELALPNALDTTAALTVRADFGWQHGDLTGATGKQTLIAAMLYRGEP